MFVLGAGMGEGGGQKAAGAWFEDVDVVTSFHLVSFLCSIFLPILKMRSAVLYCAVTITGSVQSQTGQKALSNPSVVKDVPACNGGGASDF